MMFKATDQLGNTINFKETPKRVISLVPSQSELLWDLGLKEELIGITKFCVHPDEMFRSVERVGGTKMLDLDKIRQLNPDLIIGNKEENKRSQIEILQKEFNVWMSDIYDFEGSFEMIKAIAEIFNKTDVAHKLVLTLRESLHHIKQVFKNESVAYFIWNKPYMVAAKDTFIDHVLNHLGLVNTFSHLERYPEVTQEQLEKANPTLCFLSSEPFPFEEKHAKDLQKILPLSKIVIVDGEVFSWYGTRLSHLEKYVREELLIKLR